MILKNMAELARHMKLSASAIYKARTDGKIYLEEDGSIDTTNELNFAYIVGASKKAILQRGGYPSGDYLGKDETIQELEEEEIRARIEWKNRQSRKLDFEHELRMKNIVPIEVACLWIGYFSSGINHNFLTLGKRIAKNNKDLREKIDAEITKAIVKTRDTAAAQLRAESEKLIEAMEANKNVET